MGGGSCSFQCLLSGACCGAAWFTVIGSAVAAGLGTAALGGGAASPKTCKETTCTRGGWWRSAAVLCMDEAEKTCGRLKMTKRTCRFCLCTKRQVV